jgi:putative FmdB family regulatory protein
MPIYEYECNECGNRFERFVRSTDDEIACEKCGSTELQRLLSAFSTSCPVTIGGG